MSYPAIPVTPHAVYVHARPNTRPCTSFSASTSQRAHRIIVASEIQQIHGRIRGPSMVRLTTMGEFGVEINGRVVRSLPTDQCALLLYLALQPGKRIGRPSILQTLWPDLRDDDARTRLRHCVYALRKLRCGLLREHLWLELPTSAVEIDVNVELARYASGSIEATGAFGPLFNNFPGAVSRRFSAWLDGQRARLQISLRQALLKALSDNQRGGHWESVDLLARRCLSFDSLNESATLALAEAAAMTGNKAEALKILDAYIAELGVRRTPGEIQLPAEILRERVSERMPQLTSRSDSKFLGRHVVLEPLTEMVLESRNGRGRGILIAGDAGIGKTRLTREVERFAELSGVNAMTVTCHVSTKPKRMHVLRELISELRSQPGAIGCVPRSWHLLERWDNGFSDSPDLATPVAPSDGAVTMSLATSKAILDLVDAVTDETPILIIIDDAHWIDRPSAEFLSDLIEMCDAKRISILLTARQSFPDDAPLGSGTRNLSFASLDPLEPSESAALLNALFSGPRRALDLETLQRYVDMANGNPRHIHELAEYWLRNGAADGVPASLSAAISKRVGALSKPALRVLQACILLSDLSTLERLERVAECQHSDLLQCICELEENGLISLFDSRLASKPGLVADVAMSFLPTISRMYLERRIAVSLEVELADSCGSPMLWDCVRHYQAAGERITALRLVISCAQQLVKSNQAIVALSMLNQAYDYCDAEAEVLQVKARILSIQHLLGDIDGVRTTAIELTRMGGEGKNAESVAVDLRLGILESASYAGKSSPLLYAEASHILSDVNVSTEQRARAGVATLMIASAIFDRTLMKEAYERFKVLCQRSKVDRGQRAMGDTIFHCECGNLDLAVAAGQDLVEVHRSTGSMSGLARSLRCLARASRYAGFFDAARDALSEALEIAERLKSPDLASSTATKIALTYIDQSDFDSAKKWLSVSDTYVDTEQKPLRTNEVRFYATVIAAIEDNAAAAMELGANLTRGIDITTEQPVSRPEYYILGVGILADLLYRGVNDPQRTHQFFSLFRQWQGSGDQDIPAYCGHRFLLTDGKADGAKRFLSEYASRRRERSPLPTFVCIPNGRRLPDLH
jgi:DNA-binding SARP family transcriptional activator